MISASGSGKTHLVRILARAEGLRYIRLTYGDWVPRGSKQTSTFERIRDELRVAGAGAVLLHLDEIDKVQTGFGSDWSSSVHAEIFGILDHDSSHCFDHEGRRWSEDEVERFQSRMFVVASGAWQDVTSRVGQSSYGRRRPCGIPGASSVDYGPRTSTSSSEVAYAAHAQRICQDVRTSRMIPEELLLRVSQDYIVVPPLTAEDLREMAESSGLESLLPYEPDYETLANSGLGFRALESLATRAALLQAQSGELH